MIESSGPSRFSSTSDGVNRNRIRGLTANVQAGSFATRVPGPMTESLVVLVWRNRWLMLICIVVSLVAAVVYVRSATPIYISTARLYLDYVSIIPDVTEAGKTPQTETYLYTQAGLLKSRPVVDAAVESLGPERLQTFKGVDVPTAFVHECIDVDVGRKDQIISVSFESPYPVEAAQIVNKLVAAYMSSRSEHERRNATQVLKILQDEMGRANEELARKRNAFEEFQMNQMPLAMGSDQGSGVQQRYLELQAAYTRAQMETMEAEAFLEGVKTLARDPVTLRCYVQTKGSGASYVGISTERTPLETRLTEFDLLREGLSTRLTSDHPMVASVTSEVDWTAERLAKTDRQFATATLAAAEQEAADAKEHTRQLATMCDEQRGQVAMLNREVAQYQRLRSEVDQLAHYRETIEQQVWGIQKIVGEDIGQLRMAVLEDALPATNPSKPQKARVMVLAMVIGLLLGGGVAVARDWLDQTLRSTDEISDVLGLPVLGTVPAMPRHQEPHVLGQEVSLRRDSHMAEAFRSVRTAIFFGAPKDKAKTLLVTSPGVGDGKSILVSNLAIVMASAGQRTIIVDADLRKPKQHLIFEMDHQEKSLSGVLERKTKLREAIQPGPVEKLSLLTCGREFSSPAEVLNSPEFALILKRLADVYDRVLIDAPPVTVVADARIVSTLCDFTILVLRADKTTKKMARYAIESLQSVGARVLGVIVNDVRGSDNRYGYYPRYRRSYGDTSNGDKDKGTRPAGKSDGRPVSTVGPASGREG